MNEAHAIKKLKVKTNFLWPTCTISILLKRKLNKKHVANDVSRDVGAGGKYGILPHYSKPPCEVAKEEKPVQIIKDHLYKCNSS